MDNKDGPTADIGGPSLLGAGSRITGNLSVSGAVELPGRVNGRIETPTVVVDETREVEGEIHDLTTSIKERSVCEVVGGNVILHATA